MIKSIRLINWRSHADTELRFSEGTNLLMGRMGAGKSSVMDAISFALFGTFPALERRKLRLQDIFRLNEDKASVALEFSCNGADYKVERTLTKGKSRVESDAKLFRGAAMLESGPEPVKTYISGLLAVDYDLFTRAIYSEQNNIDYFLSLDPRRRKEELDALLGLDRFEAARQNAVSVINRIRADRKALDGTFSIDGLEKTKKEHAAQKEGLESLRARLAAASGQEETAAKALQEAEKSLAALSAKKDAHERLSRERVRLEAIASQLRTELEGKAFDAGALGRAKAALSAKRQELDSGKSDLKGMDAKIAELSKSAGFAKAKIEHAARAGRDLEAKRKELSSLLEGKGRAEIESMLRAAETDSLALASEQKSLLASIKDMEELVKGMKPGASKCPVCDGPLGEHGIEHLISEKKARIADMQKRSAATDIPLAERRKTVSALSLRLNRAASLQDAMARLEKDASGGAAAESEAAEIATRLASGQEAKAALDKRLAALAQEAQSLVLECSRMEELAARKSRLTETESGLSKAAEQLASLGFDPVEYDACRKRAEDARLSFDRALNGRKPLEAQASMLATSCERLAKELSRLELAKRDSERHAALEGQLTIYKDALLETQASLRSELASAINSAMAEVWPIFYPYGNYPCIRLTASEKDYTIEIEDRSAWKPLESVASGGERACAALTIRVALAAVLTPNLSWLVLDEPTHNLDAEAIRLLSDTLQARVPDVVKQTFVITHDEGLLGADFASAYRLSRDKAGAGATKSERI
jgi:exonuclease SbcC